jgi:phospholipase C
VFANAALRVHSRPRALAAAFALGASALQACSAVAGGRLQNTLVPAAARDEAASTSVAGKHIKHVVVIIQENRSFSNFFAGYPGAQDAPMYGYQYNPTTQQRVKIALQPLNFSGPDFDHTWAPAIADYDNGKMDGYPTAAYGYMRRPLVKPLWTMAQQYVLADHMYPEEFGPSFTSHISLVAATTNLSSDAGPNPVAEVNLPSSAWRCNADPGTVTSILTPGSTGLPVTSVLHADGGPFPCFTQFNTMAQVLDEHKLSWKWYNAPLGTPYLRWDPFDSIKYVWDGPDETRNIIHPQQQVIYDARKGQLPAVSWVTPDWKDSDHTGNGSDTGPSWVTAVVNAIGQSPEWDSTAIFIVWDDWGGWYDGSVPPQKDFTGLGERVPFLVVSPYAKKGFVSHTGYELSSTLKFMETVFGLPVIGPPSFGYTDTRAANLLDCFNFAQKPRAYKTIPSRYPTSYFLHETPSFHVPDDV